MRPTGDRQKLPITELAGRDANMRTVPIVLIVICLCSCQRDVPSQYKVDSESPSQKNKTVKIPREKALYIAGEIVAEQRLNRSRDDTRDNEPDLVVTQVLPIPGRPAFAIVVCRYRGLFQGYAFLVRHDHYPLDKVAMFGGDQYHEVKAVKTVPAKNNGVIIEVSHVTGRGNYVGTDKLLLKRNNTVQWLQRSDAR